MGNCPENEVSHARDRHRAFRFIPRSPGGLRRFCHPPGAGLELTFSEGTLLPEQFRNGAFIGQHGSWNRKPRSGYKVIFVPFANGKPAGEPKDVLTGFVKDDDALGRPVGVAIDRKGALLVADDVGNTIWRVTPSSTTALRQ